MTTVVQHLLINAAQEAQTSKKVTAEIVPPAGVLLDGSENVEPVIEESDQTGLVALALIPSSEYVYDPAVYAISWDGRVQHHILVPDSGPADLMDVLTVPPDAGPGAYIPVPGPAGATGATGAAGATGPAGTGLAVVTGITTRVAPVLAKTVTGATTFYRGQTRYDLGDDFGADITGATESSTEALAWLAEAETAAAAGQRVVVTATGDFLIDTATRLFIAEGVSASLNNSLFTFTDPDGGFSVGNLVDNPQTGLVENVRVSGDDTARMPFYIGWVINWDFRNIDIRDGGYDAGDTTAQKNKSAGLVVEAAQNCQLANVTVKTTGHRGMVFDFGCGGLTFRKSQINDIGEAGSADARHVVVMQSLAATDPSLPPVYDYPTNITFDRGYIEGVNATQLRMVDVGESEDVKFRGVRFSASSRATAMVQVLVEADAHGVVLDGVHFQGNNAAANPTKVVTGVQVTAGANGARLTGPWSSSNMAAVYTVDDNADFMLDTRGHVTSGTAEAAGVGARRVVRSYAIRASTLANLPTPGLDYLGARGIVTATAAGGFDEEYVCLRRGGAYLWAPSTTGGTAPIVITHAPPAEVIISTAAGSSYTLTATGDVALGQTTNNTDNRFVLLVINPGASPRVVSFDTTGSGAFVFTTAVPGPTLTVPANKQGRIGWQYSSVDSRNHLLAFTVDA